MPKTPSNKLFHLIKSLSGSEKRYFKLFVHGPDQRESKYLALFDAIENQEEFDDEALKKAVYGPEAITSRKYSELKGYLYGLILKSLQSYDEKASVDHRLKNILQRVRALFRRSLFDDCRENLAKARKLAIKYEQFSSLLEILGWEKQIAYTEADIDFLDQELGRIHAEEQEALAKLKHISEYRNIFFRLLVSLRKDATRQKEEQKERLAQAIDSPLMKEASNRNSHHAQVLYHRIFSLYYHAISELENFYEESKLLIELMESKPHMLKEDVSEYIAGLSNFIVSCGRTNRLEEVEENLNKLYHVSPKTLDDEGKIHRQYYQNIFSLYILKGEFQEGMKLLDRHLKERMRFDDNFFETPTFYINYFYICFGAGAYGQALEFLNKLMNLPHSVERQDLQSMARIMNLIVHYELGNFVLLESLIRSAYRFLKKRNKLHDMERQFLTFMRRAIEAPTKKELKEACKSLKQDYSDSFQQLYRQSFFGNVVTAWLDSKIEGKTFDRIIKERFERDFSYK